MAELINRVAASKLQTLAIDSLSPPVEAMAFDLADYLWQGLALRERDFRAALKDFDWTVAQGRLVCVFCSADAIVPRWAYMLVTAQAANHATDVFAGTVEEADQHFLLRAAEALDLEPYRDVPVVVKGCAGGRDPGAQVYTRLTFRLRGVASSIMYGEPCSTVPIWRQPRERK